MAAQRIPFAAVAGGHCRQAQRENGERESYAAED